MADHKKIDEATGVETVGHEWDGIEELNNPLPRWWVLTFYACILFAIAYVVIYPAIPGRHSRAAAAATRRRSRRRRRSRFCASFTPPRRTGPVRDGTPFRATSDTSRGPAFSAWV